MARRRDPGGVGARSPARTWAGTGHSRRTCRSSRTWRSTPSSCLTLAVEVENRFRVCLDEEDEAAIETVGDLVDDHPEEACRAGRRRSLTLLDARPRHADEGLRVLDRRGGASGCSWATIRDRRAQRVAGGLQALGVQAGERVALVFPTGRDSSTPSSASLLAGAVPVPLYPPVRLGRLDEYHARTARDARASAGARLVLADRGVRRLLGEAVAAARPALGCRTLDELGPRRPAPGRRYASRQSDLAPGAVLLRHDRRAQSRWRCSHRALVAQATAAERALAGEPTASPTAA